VSERLELPGFVPFGDELLAHYRRAHAFVHIAVTEGVPAAIVEALAAGIPVVATDVGGVSAAVGRGEAAILVPPGDAEALRAAVEALARDPALRRRIAETGLELARAATIEAEAGGAAEFLLSRAGGTR
jgi:glycosyltransferase involved in cell wall biosynthesis